MSDHDSSCPPGCARHSQHDPTSPTRCPEEPVSLYRLGYAPGELLRLFDGFTIVKHEQVEGTYDWGPERIQLVRFVARKPAR